MSQEIPDVKTLVARFFGSESLAPPLKIDQEARSASGNSNPRCNSPSLGTRFGGTGNACGAASPSLPASRAAILVGTNDALLVATQHTPEQDAGSLPDRRRPWLHIARDGLH